jgi:hypothetical protein
MSYHAARALTRKIIRAHMPSPMEHILAYSHMPSTYRASMLARYQSREEFWPSSILNPVLQSSGLCYEQFQMGTGPGGAQCLRPVPLISATGAPVAQYHGFHVELEYASGIPLPASAHRSDILARRCRVCILDGSASMGKPLSNLYIAKAEWDPSEEDRWKFGLRFEENSFNEFMFKSDSKECTVLFELTCLVKKQGATTGSTSSLATQNPGKAWDHPTEQNFIELSCGFATLELDLANPLPNKSDRLSRGILGGNLSHSVAIKDSEILARRTGFKAFTQLFSGPVKSQLVFRITPLGLREERPQNYARFVPCNLILPWVGVEVVKLFLELLAHFVLLPGVQPIHVGRSSQLAIQFFLKGIVDTQDLLQVLAENWMDTRKSIKKAALREHDSGAINHALIENTVSSGGSGGGVVSPTDAQSDTTSAHLLKQYRRCILRLLPALSMAPGVLPPFILGISDLKRLSLLRALVHVADPLAVLTADGMLRGTTGGLAGGSAPGTVGGTTGVTKAPMSLAKTTEPNRVRADVAAASASAAAALAAQQSYGGGAGGAWRGPNAGPAAIPNVSGDGAVREDGSLDPYAGSVEFRHIYAPFHTDEISFDPNGHSGQPWFRSEM